MRGVFAMRVAAPALATVLLLCGSAHLSAQVINGRVVDAASTSGIPQARVEVLRNSDVVTQTLTDSDGRFQVHGRGAGGYILRASALGYPPTESVIQLETGELVEVTLRISPAPIAIEGLTVEARRTDLKGAATYEGFFARWQDSPAAGSSRVVHRTDNEMFNAFVLDDVLQWFRSPRDCIHWYINGEPEVHSEILAEALRGMSARELEGVEYYRDGSAAPIDYWGGSCGPEQQTNFSVIALWYRR
jgi:hypothetical protein